MTGNEYGYGCRNDCMEIRKKYAKISLLFNKKNEKFVLLFGRDI
jgi:hypothetical protein